MFLRVPPWHLVAGRLALTNLRLIWSPDLVSRWLAKPLDIDWSEVIDAGDLQPTNLLERLWMPGGWQVLTPAKRYAFARGARTRRTRGDVTQWIRDARECLTKS